MKLGCTSFALDTLDQKHLLGRTYDFFGNLEGNKLTFTPRIYPTQLEINKEKSKIINGKYSFLGMSVIGLVNPIMVDGINEKGLMGALLNYPQYAIYNTQKGEHQINIHPAFFLNYILSQCKTIEDIVEKCKGLNFVNDTIQGEEMSVHYILSDTTGETIIVEPDKKGIIIHRNTIGVLTNSPDYIWQRTNLSNYVGVTNLHKPPQTIINYQVNGFGEGVGGGFGLPGDYSSPARFVKIAFLKEFMVKPQDEIDGITKMFHNFATVDIPEGILKECEEKEHYEKTLFTSAMCGESLTYYFSSSTNRRISAIQLKNEIKGTQIKYFELQEKQDIAYIN